MQEIETVEDGYKVDGEVGRFCFNTYRAICNNDCVINTATDVFPVLKGKQWYRTKGFKDIAIFYGDIDNSFRKTTKLINRVRYQQTFEASMFEASMPACLSEEIIKNATADLDGEWDTQEILDNPVNYKKYFNLSYRPVDKVFSNCTGRNI